MKNTKMKNIIGFFIMAVVLMITGCKETPVEKEVIIVPSKTVIVEKAPAEKSTSITLDKKGVELKSEELDVKIEND
ncbi:MAG: hypothetical protein GZ086_04605 [Gelidibacter sp.]|nr:hypothetical protein [Gelidibacter sp.]